MENSFQRTKKTLAELSRSIEEKDIAVLRSRREWSGADVVITSQTQDRSQVGGFYPEPRTVVTRFSAEVSWLFERLRDAFSGLIDGTSKIEFYGRLAKAAASYQNKVNGGENAKEIMRVVLYEAVAMLEEMEEGTFDFLEVTSGNTILADLVEESERSGYMGVEATAEFFQKMEEKHL
ncbi:MAG: hypothetical protein KBD94_00690 [Pyrinomonadaceae bacterium]|nr:hypothetical protein [Pyrinomonadaceae bacterium]